MGGRQRYGMHLGLATEAARRGRAEPSEPLAELLARAARAVERLRAAPVLCEDEAKAYARRERRPEAEMPRRLAALEECVGRDAEEAERAVRALAEALGVLL